MHSLPLFHRLAGHPVIVLGEGAAAEPKARLVERAGGVIVRDIQQGIDEGARLAFVAHEDQAMCEADAIRLRCAGLLVNVVDRPELCDFTTPSLLEREPVLVAIGTGGASAGLAKQLRLRLEAMLPQGLGALASGLAEMRDAIRHRFPLAAERRQALDAALAPGGMLDPMAEESAALLPAWLEGAAVPEQNEVHEIVLRSDDPDALTLRQARLLGTADAIIADSTIPLAILNRARADAQRLDQLPQGELPSGIVLFLRSAE